MNIYLILNLYKWNKIIKLFLLFNIQLFYSKKNHEHWPKLKNVFVLRKVVTSARLTGENSIFYIQSPLYKVVSRVSRVIHLEYAKET